MLPDTPVPGAIRQLLRTDKRVTTTGGPTVEVGSNDIGVFVGGSPKLPVIVDVNPFLYEYAATNTQIHANRDVAFFFQEKDLHPGAKMNLHFTRAQSNAVFLHRAVASSIPFSTEKLADILSLLSVGPNSEVAVGLKTTLQACKESAVAGETRYCATSLESMVDFATASLGTRDVLAVSTELSKDGTPKQEYVIESTGIEKLLGRKVVACHAQWYAYAVFHCHVTRATKAYVVSLVGRDGAKVNAVVVCHTDTSNWNPTRHGSVCHFLPQDHIVWASRR
ncbi:unnamed protein product [Spirodela intermedia]|uniref:BURP domain-containing protein n=1 Tax=Spirodela intermedia TaxID=51605 RepID=A0A7I8J7B3_SPIIN|nr:unnamed protein product [Spirodela intermedia]CAA6665961.1 unnamed protein product [Spirodela intermedia]